MELLTTYEPLIDESENTSMIESLLSSMVSAANTANCQADKTMTTQAHNVMYAVGTSYNTHCAVITCK